MGELDGLGAFVDDEAAHRSGGGGAVGAYGRRSEMQATVQIAGIRGNGMGHGGEAWRHSCSSRGYDLVACLHLRVLVDSGNVR